MKKIILLAIITFFASAPLLAQYSPCYESAMKKGNSLFKKKDYEKAKLSYEEARDCEDSNKELANQKIDECNEAIDKQKEEKKAKKDQDKKEKIDKNEQKRREENERLEREAEEERLRQQERRLAEKGYMDLKGVCFDNVNIDYQGNIVSIPQETPVLYAGKVRYIRPKVRYQSLDTKRDTVAFYVKMIGKDGEVLTDRNSRNGFSYSLTSVIEPDQTDASLLLKPWGDGTDSYYSPGEYRFELWIYDSNTGSYNKILPAIFNVEEAPVKEITLNVSLDSKDSNADIYVDGNLKGQRKCKVNLPPGDHEIVCVEKQHANSTKTVALTEDLGELSVVMESPKPIMGSLDIESQPSSAQLFVDGISVGQTPVQNYPVKIGNHDLKLVKKGYNDASKTVLVSEGGDKLTIPMVKQRRERAFGTFFLDGVYGNFNGGDMMLGGHMALCPRHVGVYAQYLLGLDYDSYQATGGLVFRLTEDYVDFQLYAGAGYGCFRSWETITNESFLIDFGGRIGWRSSTKWAMWDIVGGCSVTPDGDWYPYVGVGTGFSLISALTVLTLQANGMLR